MLKMKKKLGHTAFLKSVFIALKQECIRKSLPSKRNSVQKFIKHVLTTYLACISCFKVFVDILYFLILFFDSYSFFTF